MGRRINTFYTMGYQTGVSSVLNMGYVYGQNATDVNQLPSLLGMTLTPWCDDGQHQRGQVMLSFTSSRTKVMECLPLRIATYLRLPGHSSSRIPRLMSLQVSNLVKSEPRVILDPARTAKQAILNLSSMQPDQFFR